MTKEKETWLPNLVGGVSIWKLADDLNQERFFDGRLLVPETEGSDSLPVKVEWAIEGLVPLAEAQAKHPEAATAATQELFACLERVRKELSSESSGYRRFKDALTMPSIEGAGAANYFFDPNKKKLFVINWGASPRSVGAAGQLVFGYDRFEELAKRAGAAGVAAAAVGAGAAAAVATAAAPDPGAPTEQKKEDKPDEKKDEAKKRPLWFWIALAALVIILVVLLGYLLRGCSKTPSGKPGADAGLDGATSASPSASASNSAAPGADAGPDASMLTDGGLDADGGPSDGGDADADGGDAGADGGDADADGGTDGGTDGGKDGGADGGKDGGGETSGDNSGTPPEDGKVYVVLDGGGSGAGSGSGSAGSGGGGKPRPKPSRPIPFRSHFQPGASAWRITSGAEVVDDDFPPVMNNGAFEVYLKPGHTFSEIVVEYKDKSGTWHKH